MLGIFFMFMLLNFDCHSKVGICTCPDSLRTGTGIMALIDGQLLCATSSTSLIVAQELRRNVLLKHPKYRSDWNLVCPVGRNEIWQQEFFPIITRHMSQRINMLFLFCPAQLSAWSSSVSSPIAKFSKKWCNRDTTVFATFPHTHDSGSIYARFA